MHLVNYSAELARLQVRPGWAGPAAAPACMPLRLPYRLRQTRALCCCPGAEYLFHWPACSFAERLLQFPDVFQRSSSSNGGGSGVAVHPRLATQQQRTEAIAGVLQQLRDEVGIVEAT